MKAVAVLLVVAVLLASCGGTAQRTGRSTFHISEPVTDVASLAEQSSVRARLADKATRLCGGRYRELLEQFSTEAANPSIAWDVSCRAPGGAQ